MPLDGDDDYKIVYVGTEVFTTYTAQCTAPCIFVLPPVSISTTTISIPPYTTSLQVGSGVGTTTTVTLHPDSITTGSIGYSNVQVTSDQSAGYGFVPSPSIDVPPETIVVTGPDGKSTSRTRQALRDQERISLFYDHLDRLGGLGTVHHDIHCNQLGLRDHLGLQHRGSEHQHASRDLHVRGDETQEKRHTRNRNTNASDIHGRCTCCCGYRRSLRAYGRDRSGYSVPQAAEGQS